MYRSARFGSVQFGVVFKRSGSPCALYFVWLELIPRCVFAGLIFASAAVGVAAGYVTAGQTLSFFVDFDTMDTDK